MRTVPLYGQKAAGRVALVDDADYKLVMLYRWNVLERIRPGRRPQGPYPIANAPHPRYGVPMAMPMHKLLTGYPLTDHINHDGLDNQRHNLRPATRAQNLQNQRGRLGCTSRYKGVRLHLPTGSKRWRASIKVSGKNRHLGLFVTEEEAARAYDAAAREIFGEYACPNFPV